MKVEPKNDRTLLHIAEVRLCSIKVSNYKSLCIRRQTWFQKPWTMISHSKYEPMVETTRWFCWQWSIIASKVLTKKFPELETWNLQVLLFLNVKTLNESKAGKAILFSLRMSLMKCVAPWEATLANFSNWSEKLHLYYDIKLSAVYRILYTKKWVELTSHYYTSFMISDLKKFFVGWSKWINFV